MRTFWLVPLAMAAVTLLAVADQKSGLLTWMRLRSELSESRVRIAARVAETEELRAEIRALESDPFALERAIREDLEQARSGEIVVRFGTDRKPGSRALP